MNLKFLAFFLLFAFQFVDVFAADPNSTDETKIAETGSSYGADQLAIFLRSLVDSGLEIPAFNASVLKNNGGTVLFVPAEVTETEMQELNRRLRESGFTSIQFSKVGDLKKPGLTRGYIGWMMARNLLLPTAVFLAAYFVGVTELFSNQLDAMAISGEERSRADLITPYIVAGATAALLQIQNEIFHKFWERVGALKKFGPVLIFLYDLFSPALIQLAGSAAASRPWQRGWQSVPFPDAVLWMSFTAAVLKTFSYRLGSYAMFDQSLRKNLGQTSFYALDGILLGFTQVTTMLFLCSRAEVPALGLGAFMFFSISAPLAIKNLIGNRAFDEITAIRGGIDPQPRTKAFRICRKIASGISRLYSFPRALLVR